MLANKIFVFNNSLAKLGFIIYVAVIVIAFCMQNQTSFYPLRLNLSLYPGILLLFWHFKNN